MKLILIFILLFSFSALSVEYPSDWIQHKSCQKDTRWNKKYCLEIIEIKWKKNQKPRGVILMTPGFFQNGFSFDLLPEKKISVARYYMKKGLKVFMLHVRGIGNSDLPKKSNLDDIAVDDIPAGIRFVSKLNNGKEIHVLGHSQGAITLQMSLGGLTRCKVGNCFSKLTAFRRQSYIRSISLSAGNVMMTDDKNINFLDFIGNAGKYLGVKYIIKPFHKIPASIVTKYLAPADTLRGDLISKNRLWEFLYHVPNVSKEAQEALYDKTLDGTTPGIINQFLVAINDLAVNTSGESLNSGLANIYKPTYQLTYGRDTLAEPVATKRDTFDFIYSRKKVYQVIENRGHEDFMMNEKLHADLDQMIEFALIH